MANRPRTFATPDNPIVQKVSQELRGDYKKNFVRGGTVYFEHFPAYTVRYPTIDASQYPARFVEFIAGNLTDRCAKDTLEKEFKCLNWLRECTHLIPLYTTGDGNCLLHAASLAMWGFEDREFILRNALYESLTTADRNTNTLQDRCRMSISSMLRDVQAYMSDNDWFSEWQQIVNQARPNSSGHHQSLEESHIFVLANVLRRPIIVYGVPKVRSFNTGGTMQNINFHGIYLPLLWGSQLCHKPPLCLGYGMGHFTALVPAGNPQQQLTVPLTDNKGHVLPIRFLLQAEEQNTFYLLEQYIDVIKLYSASMGKQIQAAVIDLREAAHMRHLVHGYIDVCLVEFNKQNQPYYAESQPAAAPQGEVQRQQCVGCNSGVYASAETNFLCSICYKKQTSAAAGYNPSQGLKCRSPGCQQQGVTSKDGYCNECYTKSCNPSSDQFQWNDFNAGKAGNPRVPDVHNPPPPRPSGEPGERQKCYKCKDFYANEEYGGLCSGCFKKLTIEESQQKPQFSQPQFSQPQHVQAQPTPIQANNNAEPVPEKCKVCKDFHGDVQYGGLCSVCFKKKSKEESTAKPPQQPLNDLRQNPKQEQIYHPQQASPAHQQQPVYNQGQVNPPPGQQPNVFGFNECMSRGCARPADEQCQGYCVQCFGKSVERYQQSQQNQWQQHQQQQQEEQARRQREFQETERQRLEQERRRQQEDNNRMEQQRQQEIMRQQAMEKVPQRNDQQMQYQAQQPKPQDTSYVPQQPRHAATAPITTGELCYNSSCGDFAVPNCNGYCLACFSSNNQPADAATSHNHSPTVNSMQRPAIKPRKNLPKTDLISTVTKPPNESVETMSVGGRSQSFSASEIKCFMCAKVKPNTGDLAYSLCPAHAQRVAAMSLDYDTPPASQQPETSYTNQQTSNYDQQRRGSADYLQPAGPAQHRAEQKMTPHSGEQLPIRYSGEQQRRGSTDYLQSAGPVQHRAEQKMTRFSGEQHQTGRVANHYSGEQGNRSPHLSGPQTNPSNQPPHQMHTTAHHTGDQTSRQQYNQPQEPRSHTTELPFGGGTQSRFPPNSKHYGQPSAGGQPSYQQNNPAGYPVSRQKALYDDYNQGSYGRHGSHATSRSSNQDDVNQRSGSYIDQQYRGHGDQQSFQSGQNPNYDDQQHRQGGSEIKYPPGVDPSMSYGSRDYPSNDLRHPSSQFNSQPPNQYSGAGGSYPNDQYSQSYQQHQQHYDHQQNYQRQQHEPHPGGGNQGYGRSGNFGGADQHSGQPGGGNQGYGGAGNYGTAGNHGGAGAAANYPPQGAGSQHLPGQKPPISSHADPNATHPHNDDMPRVKLLCRYPGCSFYAIPEFENYCEDCYKTKSGLKNYQRCQTPTCPNLVAVSNATKLCESCLMSPANKH